MLLNDRHYFSRNRWLQLLILGLLITVSSVAYSQQIQRNNPINKDVTPETPATEPAAMVLYKHASVSKHVVSFSNSLSPGTSGAYQMYVTNDGTEAITNLCIEDSILPSPHNLYVKSIQTGIYENKQQLPVPSTLFVLYKTNKDQTYRPIPGSPFSTTVSTIVTPTLANDEYITTVCWCVDGLAEPGFSSSPLTPPALLFDVSPDTPSGVYHNCIIAKEGMTILARSCIDIPVVSPPPSTTSALSLAKIADKTRAEVGEIITYTVMLTNTGKATSGSVTVGDTLDAGLQFISATATVGTFDTATRRWSIPQLTAANQAILTVQAKVLTPGIRYNVAVLPGIDTVKVCTSIPYHVCKGSAYKFQLDAPARQRSYQWYLNGTAIASATNQTYVATDAGSYSVVINGGVDSTCSINSCCPVIIEEDSVAHYQAIATKATCSDGIPNVDGSLIVTNYTNGSGNANTYTYEVSTGSTFSSTAVVAGSATTPIPTNGVLVNTLHNPSGAGQAYTIRMSMHLPSGDVCYRDQVVNLLPASCICSPGKCSTVLTKRIF